MQNLRKGYRMNTQLKSSSQFIKIILSALLIALVVYGSMPAMPVHASTFLVNDLSDTADPSLDGICDISPGDGTENCTLRAAIMEANQANDVDVINFSVPMTLTLGSALPVISQPVVINGASSGGRVTLDGGGAGIIGFNIQASQVTVQGFSLVNFGGTAVRVSNGADNVLITNNYIGVAADGTTDGGNTEKGIRVVDSPNVTISTNLISGNDMGGILVIGTASNGVEITGNIIGLNASGTARLETVSTSGADGIRLTGVTNATIGGSSVSTRNIISGNYGNGIVITGDSTGTTVNGNYVGTNAIGESAVPNLSGIRLTNAIGVTVGTSAGNLVSGNDVAAIVVTGSTACSIANNTVGLDIDGDTLLANAGIGISVSGSDKLNIYSNVVSGNTSHGLNITNGSTELNVYNNRIGVGKTLNMDLGNDGHGINVNNSSNNRFGHTSSSLGNVIAYNSGSGIFVQNSDPGSFNSYGNTIIGNKIYSNGGLGIDLAPAGPTANDTDDVDDGPNYLQNYITFTAKQTDTGVQVTGSLNTDVLRPNYRIEFFVSNSCDASGYGEGGTLVDVYDILIVSNSTPIDYEIPDTTISAGEYLTATVTYDEGTGGLKDTSEFSPCAVVQEPDSPGSSGVFVVNSTADAAESGGQIGDGFCNVGGGVCTLRAALQEANAGSEPPYTISFNIAGTAPHTISLNSSLPVISLPTIIKGKPSGYSGPPMIIVNGSGVGSGPGFNVAAPGSIIDGLSIVSFSSGSGIEVNANNVVLKNNLVGLLANGNTLSGNQFGISVNGVSGTQIRNNVVSGNTHGIRLIGSGAENNLILNNYIGTDSSGTLDRGNTSDGLRLEGSSNNTIEGNTISGNNNDGIEVSGGASGNAINANKIGVQSFGSNNLSNNANGINMNNASNNLITNNVVAYNGTGGVVISGGIQDLISANSIYSNAGDGIDLINNGNNNAPAPSLLSALQGGSYVFVEGLLNAAPNTTYTLEFFKNASGFQGETLVLTKTVTTNGAGSVTFSAGILISVPDLTVFTTTARDSNNNTSKFSNGVFVAGAAPTLTPTPTFTPTPVPTSTFTPTSTPTNTNTPTATATSSGGGGGGGGGATATATKTNTPTITNTPTVTFTPTLLSQFQTLTQLAAVNTIEPTSTPVTPTSTLVPSPTLVPSAVPPTATQPVAEPDTGDLGDDDGGAFLDGSGGGGEAEPQGFLDGLLGGGGVTTVLWIFIILAALLLLIGGGMELMRWMNSRD